MNNPHKNARMTPLGRAEMVRRIREEGQPLTAVAAGFGISEKTARKWLVRYAKVRKRRFIFWRFLNGRARSVSPIELTARPLRLLHPREQLPRAALCARRGFRSSLFEDRFLNLLCQ